MQTEPWRPDDHDEAMAAVERAFLSDLDPAAVEPMGMLDPERSVLVRDGARVVGTLAVLPQRLAVPGAVLPALGVSQVSVQATHRRQGLLRRMMAPMLSGAADAGEPLAALWASEPAIYGRFGFGLASRSLVLHLQRGDALRSAPPVGGVRDVAAADARDELAAVWDRSFAGRPGEHARHSAAWWDHVLHDPASRREGSSALRAAVLDDGSGYALYSTRGGWDARGAAGEARVREVVGRGALRLWSYLLGLDLVARWTVSRAALDDPLLGAVADPRRLAAEVRDGLFVRLLRVDEALAARSYGTDVDVVLDVADDVLPGNARRWRLAAASDSSVVPPR